MSGTKSINWQIGLLEARSGKGASFKRARAVEQKRLRKRRSELKSEAKADSDTFDYDEINTALQKDSADAEAKLSSLRLKKLHTKLFHIKRELKSTSKTIQSFEIQKLTRQIKKIREDGGDNAQKEFGDLQHMLEKIKQVDLDKAVDLVIHRIKKKSWLVRDALDGENKDNEAVDTNSLNEDKAMQRVVNGKQMAPAVKKHIAGLEALLSGDKATPKPAKPTATSENNGSSVSDEPKPEEAEDDSADSYSSDDGFESTSDLDADIAGRMRSGKSARSKLAAGESVFVGSLGAFASNSEYSSDGGSQASHKAKKQKRVKNNKKAGASKKSDAGYDEGDDAAFDKIYGANIKKNRPGQQARRALYEAKYGSEANHIKLLAKKKKNSSGSKADNGKADNDKAQFKTNRRNAGANTSTYQNRATKDQSSKRAALSGSERLHPSWEAKRRERELLSSAPKSTKIVFGDDEPASQPQSQRPKRAALSGSERLHPSWEAKRRERELLSSAPKSTKIVFGDDEPASQPQSQRTKQPAAHNKLDQPKTLGSGPESLHPSWEAKRKQKELMEQARSVKGTKIVFD